MRILVCGDRDWTNINLIAEVLGSFAFDTLIEGECRGADRLARKVVESFNLQACIDTGDESAYQRLVLPFPANWDKYAKGAGHIRNKQMLEVGQPDLVIAFHNHIEESRGTANMLCQAEDAGVPYCLIEEVT